MEDGYCGTNGVTLIQKYAGTYVPAPPLDSTERFSLPAMFRKQCPLQLWRKSARKNQVPT